VQQNEGGITVDSAPGRGTCVTVYWPIRGRAEATEHPSATRDFSGEIRVPAPVEVQPTVLVVDDEPMLLNLMSKALERLGYRTITATDGEEALEVARDRREALAAIVSDVRMPKMSGTDFVGTLIAEGMDLPVLFVSGQLGVPIPTDWPATVPRRFLAKPFTLNQLQLEMLHLVTTPG
jgi:two-component system cell cycle sensor histidine kinase/response regulator CckA